MAISSLRIGVTFVDLDGRTLSRPGEAAVELTELEARLLAYLAQRRGTTVERHTLLSEVWGYAPGVVSRAPDHTISRLRRKLAFAARWLVGVRSGGYRLELEPRQVPDLPAVNPAFVGRDTAIRELDERLDSDGAVAVVGIGGMGKSQLALHYAHRWETETGGEALWVELGRLRSRNELLATIGAKVALRANQVLAWLHGRERLLVVLDEAEQLDEGVLDFVGELHGPRVVVTSQRPIRTIESLPLGPLALEDAVALLTARCPRPIDRREAATVAEALDGVPFALEMVGPWLAIADAAEVVARIDGLRRVRGGRHSSVQATLAWGWRDLPESGRLALGAATRFATTARVEDIEAVSGLVGLAEGCDELCRRGWFTVHEGGRFSTYQVVRTFVADQPSLPLEELEARHTAHVLTRLEPLLERLRRTKDPETTSAQDELQGDIITALRRDLDPRARATLVRGLVLDPGRGIDFADAVAEVDRALAELPADVVSRVPLLIMLGGLLQRGGQLPGSVAALEEGLGITGAPDHVAHLEAQLATTRLRMGEDVREALADAVERLATEGLTCTAASYRINLAAVFVERGQWAIAREHLRRVLEVRAFLLPKSVVACLNNLTEACMALGDVAEADAWFREAERVAVEGGVYAQLAAAYHNQGCYALDRGDPMRARTYLLEAGRLARQAGRQLVARLGKLQLAVALLEEDRPAEALETILGLAPRQSANPRFEATALARQGQIHLWMNQPERALPCLTEAVRIWDAIDAEPEVFGAELALAHLAGGDRREAVRIAARQPPLYREIVEHALAGTRYDGPLDRAEIRLLSKLADRIVNAARE